MYENDYIVRMTRQMAEVIAKLVFHKDIRNFDICHEITDNTIKENFGVSKELLLRLPATSIIELVGGMSHHEAIDLLARLLQQEGEIFEAEGNKLEAERYYQKSRSLIENLE